MRARTEGAETPAEPKKSVARSSTDSSLAPVTPGLPKPTMTPEEQEQKNKLVVAVIFTIFVVAIILGVSLGITRSNRNGGDTEPTMAPTLAYCEPVEQLFALPVMVSMAVSSSITEPEIAYTAALMQKTYTALLEGFLEEAQDYCDPYCRTITNIEVMGYELTGNITNATYVEDGCDDTLVVSYAIDGSFLACEGADFPGMFSQLRRRLRSLRGDNRFLQEACGECSDGGDGIGEIAPTEEDLVEIMDPFVTVLPTVCQLSSIDAMDDDVVIEMVNATDSNATDFNATEIPGETDAPETEPEAEPVEGETQGPPEGGWTESSCSVSVNSGNCETLFAENNGVIPCSCDGQCVNFVDGSFECNDSGSVSGSTIEAAGCSFAADADFPGFTCAV